MVRFPRLVDGDRVAVVSPASTPDRRAKGYGQRIGHIDRQLTMLRNAGHLDGVVAVAVGRYVGCGPEPDEPQTWSHLPVLRHHLHRLGVPVLGGLPIGHGPDPHTVPLGTTAEVDVGAGTLTVEPAAC